MARGFKPRGGGFPGAGGNMNQLMKQAQKMQRQLQEAQEKANTQEGESSVGGGMVKCKVDANHQVINLEIDPAIIDPEDPEMLQDMFIAAVNEAMRDLDEKVESCMSAVQGMPNMGGMLGF